MNGVRERGGSRQRGARVAFFASWACATILGLANAAHALSITGTPERLGVAPGGDPAWRLDLVVRNETLPFAVREFTIFVPHEAAGSISLVNAPEDWDWIVIQPDPFLPDDGFVDGLALGTGLAIGDAPLSLSLELSWLGGAVPAGLIFDVVDPTSFETLARGEVVVVPEASSAILLALGFTALAARRRE